MRWQLSEGQRLGWNLERVPENCLKESGQGNSFTVLEIASGERVCRLKGFPKFSLEEEKLLCNVAGLFQRRSARPEREELLSFFKTYCLQNLILLEKGQVEYLSKALEKQVFGFGPLHDLLEDDAIEEIAVIGIGEEKPVHVFHRKFGWLRTNLFFSRADYVHDLVNKMSRSIGRRLSMNSPVLNATLPNGSRLSATISPVSFTGPSVTIRKFRQLPFTPKLLVENGTFSLELMAFLWIAMQCDCSILIAGNTGSGKTSSLNALLSFVPASERLVLVEETPELRVEQRHFVKLNVVKEQAVGMQSLIVQSLRMRPDRIVVGEVRSREEVAAFIDTMLAGQGKGSYATFHAQSVKEAVNRMRSLGVLETDLASIDLVIVQRRWNRIGKQGSIELRKIVEVAELLEREGKLCSLPIFQFDYGKGCLVKVNESSKLLEKAKRSFGFDAKGFSKEIGKRKLFLSKLPAGIEMREFFKRVNACNG